MTSLVTSISGMTLKGFQEKKLGPRLTSIQMNWHDITGTSRTVFHARSQRKELDKFQTAGNILHTNKSRSHTAFLLTKFNMQTFLPLPSFKKSAEVLDYKRLGNQRNEAKTVYNIITKKITGGAWKGHPCTLMWAPYPHALALYFNEICKAWESRGYINNIARLPVDQNLLKFPPWMGHHDFHSSHRAALLYKDFEWYSQFGWCEQPQLHYLWPVYDEALAFKLAWR